MLEQTLSIIKPDAVERNLDNKIKSFFESKKLKIIKSKKVKITKDEAEEFYKVHQTKPFYNDLCNLAKQRQIDEIKLDMLNILKDL